MTTNTPWYKIEGADVLNPFPYMFAWKAKSLMLYAWPNSPFLLFGSKHLEVDWAEFLKQEPVDGSCSEEALLVVLDLEQVFRSHILVPTWLAHHQFVST